MNEKIKPNKRIGIFAWMENNEKEYWEEFYARPDRTDINKPNERTPMNEVLKWIGKAY